MQKSLDAIRRLSFALIHVDNVISLSLAFKM